MDKEQMVKRRSLLKLAATGAVASTLSMGSAAASRAGAGNKGLSYPWNKLACNIEFWYQDLPFLERIDAAAKAGFKAVEFWMPNNIDRNPKAIAQRCNNNGIKIVQFTGWAGDSMGLASTAKAFAEGMKKTVEIAHILDAPMFTIVGHQNRDKVATLPQTEKLANYQRALELAAPVFENARKMSIIEPFNPFDHKGFFLNGSTDALAICRAINSPYIKINWDFYHMQLSEGNLVHNMRKGLDQIGYLQIANTPGRHEPGTGEQDYGFIFKAIRDLSYAGYIGLECIPQDGNSERAIKRIRASLTANGDWV